MDDFMSIGDRVVVIENELHPEFVGQEGVIEELGAAFHFWVMMPDGIMYGFNEHELELLPATKPTAAAQGEGESWGVNPTERELVAYGDGYASGLMDGPEYAPLKNEIIALQAALQQAQRERDAALATLKPFAVFGTEFIRIRVNGDDPMHSDRVTHALNDVEITVGDWQAATSAQQAANAEGGA